MSNIKYSVLDLVTVSKGETVQQAIARSTDTAVLTDRLGYERYWFSEHHNMPNVASAATSILIGHIAQATQHIRVGSGGIMLPNHSTLLIAEQFGTLGSIYPGRIDLGLGRAPGTDGLTAMTIRKQSLHQPYDFKHHIRELQQYFSPDNHTAKVRALPGEGVDIPLYILGSSTDSAYLAAQMGLPYAFATHFAPTHFAEAMYIYHNNFQPSAVLQEPYAIACIQVLIGKDPVHAAGLGTSVYRNFLNIITDTRSPMEAPISAEEMQQIWTPEQEAYVKNMLQFAMIGDTPAVTGQLYNFMETYPVQEIMALTQTFYQEDRRYSYIRLQSIIDGYNTQAPSSN